MISHTVFKNDTLEQSIDHFPRFALDEQLALLWKMRSYFEAAVRTTAADESDTFARNLFENIQGKSFEEQCECLQDIASNENTQLSREYGALYTDKKLVFWHLIGRGVEEGSIAPLPEDYHLSPPAQEFLQALEEANATEKLALLRCVVETLGVNPMASAVFSVP
ncbi:orange carotenoid protein N-terminal domain-containing protein [Baaleninema sp.]|uniref:orange carotenoid protein N-terminal domain-containing protein n=1 Tax=Baaleninema sp. TaxID=3101197 RepID=UPI003CFE0A9D